MTDTYTIKKVPRPSYTKRLRIHTPSLFIIHATRGHTTLDLQDDATLSWFTTGSIDRGGWGSTADVLISADDDFIYEFGDIMREHSTWSAGYGALGPSYEYGADEWGISIELAQTAAQEPFTPKVIDKLVWYVQKRSKDFKLDIPAVHITEWSQRRTGEVPTGFIGHDETANGRKTGKLDPGKQFPWEDFLRRVKGEPVARPKLSALGAASTVVSALLLSLTTGKDVAWANETVEYEGSTLGTNYRRHRWAVTWNEKVKK